MPDRQTTVAGLPALSLYTDRLELVGIPEAGARITHLRLRRRGREWLWRNRSLPFVLPPADPGPSPSIYVDRYDSGGSDECFPTVGACPRPGSSPEGPWLPDHGELWRAPWRHDVFTRGGFTTWRSVTECGTVPAVFSRQAGIDESPDGESGKVSFEYRLRSTGAEPFPYLWSAHPLLNVQPGTTVELPGVSQVRVGAVQGLQHLVPDAETTWPPEPGDRFTIPAPAGWAAKLFARSPSRGRAVVTDPLRGEALELQWDGGETPWVGLWLNPGGFGPTSEPYYNLAAEPCLAAPDQLDRAVREWRMAPFLRPGEDRTWRLTVVLREASS
jgi:galactose mutarotase-like enzyme